jgi:hypothetical protein
MKPVPLASKATPSEYPGRVRSLSGVAALSGGSVAPRDIQVRKLAASQAERIELLDCGIAGA